MMVVDVQSTENCPKPFTVILADSSPKFNAVQHNPIQNTHNIHKMSTTLAAEVSKEVMDIDLSIRAALFSGEIEKTMEDLHARIVRNDVHSSQWNDLDARQDTLVQA
jgi:hypothetical protein